MILNAEVIEQVSLSEKSEDRPSQAAEGKWEWCISREQGGGGRLRACLRLPTGKRCQDLQKEGGGEAPGPQLP